MRKEQSVDHSSFIAKEPETLKKRGRKLEVAMAMALALSACMEKAKTWTADQLAEFSKTDSYAERIESGRAEVVNRAMEKFRQVAHHDKAVPNSIDYSDPIVFGENGDKAILRDGAIEIYTDKHVDIVVDGSKKHKPHEDNFNIWDSKDISFKLAQDPNTQRETVIMGYDSFAKRFDVAVDPSTGMVISAQAERTGHVEKDTDVNYELALGKDGKLKVVQGERYTPGQGKKLAEFGIKEIEELEKALDTQLSKLHEKQ